MDNKIIENLEKLKKMLVLLSEERKVVLSHHKTLEHVEKMRSIINESIDIARK
jgi:hypothetical protein